MQYLHLWIQAIRPRTLALSISPVILGTILAVQEQQVMASPLLFLLIVLAAVAIQVGTNLFNDAADFMNGTDTVDRIGPQRITASGLATPRQVMLAGGIAFAIALMIGAYLVKLGGMTILFLGIASLIAGFTYSHGPFPVSRTPFGELVVIIFFGIVAVYGTYLLNQGEGNPYLIIWGCVVGFPAAAVLMVNNTRDREGDSKAGRRTLPIVLHIQGVRLIYSYLMLAPYFLIAVVIGRGVAPMSTALAFLGTPWAILCILRFYRTEPGIEMNPLLAETVRAQLMMVVALSVGLVYPVPF